MRKLVAFLALILLAGSAVRAEPLYLDFENGKTGIWRFLPDGFARDSLGVALDGPQKNNNSRGSLHCFVRDGLVWGGVSYVLRDNGRSPIRVTPRTRVAWCWNVSKNEDTNGFWLCFNLRNTKTGAVERARFVTWIESSHTVIRAYFEPSQVWVYHCEGLYDYLWRRYEPAVVDSFVIESVDARRVVVAESRGVDRQHLDRRRGAPRRSEYRRNGENDDPLSSKLNGFSYGFLDGDWIPDRVDYVSRQSGDLSSIRMRTTAGAAAGGDSPGPAVRAKEVKPLQTSSSIRSASAASASIADLNGDGRDDILIGFDDAARQPLLQGRGSGDSLSGGAARRAGRCSWSRSTLTAPPFPTSTSTAISTFCNSTRT